MDPVRYGLVAALLIAGPSLWGLAESGSIDPGTAVVRGSLVAVACGIGVAQLDRLVRRYRVEQARARRRARLLAALDDLPGAAPPDQAQARASGRNPGQAPE